MVPNLAVTPLWEYPARGRSRLEASASIVPGVLLPETTELTRLHLVELDAGVGERRRRRRYALSGRAAAVARGTAAGESVRADGLAQVRRRDRSMRTQQTRDVRHVQRRAARRRRVRVGRVRVAAARARRSARVVSRAGNSEFDFAACDDSLARLELATRRDRRWKEKKGGGIGRSDPRDSSFSLGPDETNKLNRGLNPSNAEIVKRQNRAMSERKRKRKGEAGRARGAG